jgi:predicted 2-oxoglutarate/Fe(II)-dependent dioxygenase YbiX
MNEIANPILSMLGIRIFSEAFEKELIDDLVTSIGKSATKPARVNNSATGFAPAVAEEIRRTQEVKVPMDLKQRFAHAIDTVMLGLHPSLVRVEAITYLQYGIGDMFRAHRDRGADVTDPTAEYLRRRSVSVVVFLNDQQTSIQDGQYEGGSLLFRGLSGHGFEDMAFGPPQRRGVLVTFPSDVVHEVTPVDSGSRLTVVGFYATALPDE